MPPHDPAAYGRQVGEDYDALYPDHPDTGAAVDLLCELAAGGPVLEFGIGTGRLALPLLGRGLGVAGIEASQTIVDQLRAKPDGERIDVAIGDFATTVVAGDFSLVVLALNTVFALPSPDAQRQCFANARRHLEPGGCFVVEAFVLRPDQRTGRWGIEPRFVHADRVELQIGRYVPERRLFERMLVHLSPAGTHLLPVNDTYAAPDELDAMAGEAGFALEARWSTWDRRPFEPDSEKHVSVYRLAERPTAP